jgi:glycine/D-amino acid oxidase-like deaminating enzyme
MAEQTTVHAERTLSDMLWDVAIIGYGPTGQMLALLLGQKGYRVAVFERWPNLYPQPRAIQYGCVAKTRRGTPRTESHRSSAAFR